MFNLTQNLKKLGLKIISRALEIPLVVDAVDQTLSVHNSMLERGGLFDNSFS